MTGSAATEGLEAVNLLMARRYAQDPVAPIYRRSILSSFSNPKFTLRKWRVQPATDSFSIHKLRPHELEQRTVRLETSQKWSGNIEVKCALPPCFPGNNTGIRSSVELDLGLSGPWETENSQWWFKLRLAVGPAAGPSAVQRASLVQVSC